MTAFCTVSEAAATLNVRRGTLRRWLRGGCPVVRRGRRGGDCTLVDVDAVRCWLAATPAEQQLIALASEIPALVAGAVFDVSRAVEGPHKTSTARVLGVAGLVVIDTLLKRLNRDVPNISAELRDEPYRIARLRAN